MDLSIPIDAMRLRPYQSSAINGARIQCSRGKRAPLIVCPTGGGKTCMASAIAAGHIAKGGRVAWLAHRRELVEQAAKTLERFGLVVGYDGLRVDAPVQVTSVQTVLARGEAPAGTLAVLDEAHHFVADEWKRLPEIYKDSIIVGLTATPERKDGRGLGDVFDCMVVAAQIKDLINLNQTDPTQGLVPCNIVWPERVLSGKVLAQYPFEAYDKYANGRSAVVFAPHVKAAKEYAAQFNRSGVRAAVMFDGLADDTRADILYRFDRGDIRVLCNVYILTEGWDCPRAKVCILARTVGSAGSYLQMVGRVLRPWNGETATLIDLHGSTLEAYGRPDEERFYTLDGKGIRRQNDNEKFCRIHGIPTVNGACPQCETAGIVSELETWHSDGVALTKFESMRKLPDNKRVVCLIRWLTASRGKGHKDGVAFYKYKAVFGHWPPPLMKAQAFEYLSGGGE